MSEAVAELTGDDVRNALSELVPEDRKLGPAMKRLSERQRIFVIACLDLGCSDNHAKGARLAGYTGTDGYVRVQGWRLAHNERVQEAMLEEAKKRIQAGTLSAVNFVMQVLADDKEDTKTRLKAAQTVMDRGGLHAVMEQRAVVSGGEDRAEKLLRVALLAKLLGQDPKALLGNLADAVEGDFKVIEPAGVEGR